MSLQELPGWRWEEFLRHIFFLVLKAPFYFHLLRITLPFISVKFISWGLAVDVSLNMKSKWIWDFAANRFFLWVLALKKAGLAQTLLSAIFLFVCFYLNCVKKKKKKACKRFLRAKFSNIAEIEFVLFKTKQQTEKLKKKKCWDEKMGWLLEK